MNRSRTSTTLLGVGLGLAATAVIVASRKRDAGAAINLFDAAEARSVNQASFTQVAIIKQPLPTRVKALARIMAGAGDITVDLLASGKMASAGRSGGALKGAIMGFKRDGVTCVDKSIEGRDGPIKVRIYTPEALETAPRPLVVEFHGGGWAVGDLSTADWIASTIARDLDAIVVSVDYRLSPTHPFPAGLHDCYDALAWAASNMEMLGARAKRLGVMGESAGGNLAAAVTLMAREQGGPVIDHQVLLYPATDLRNSTRSRRQNMKGPVLVGNALDAFEESYAGKGDPTNDWRLSPLRARDKENLPPALVQIASYDPLYDDGVAYAEALRDAGVPTRLTAYTAMPHGYVNMPYFCRDAKAAMREVVAEQRKYLRADR